MAPGQRVGVLVVVAVVFGAVVALGSRMVLVPVTLYAPLFGPPSHVNIPELPLLPLLAGVLAGVAGAVVGGRAPGRRDAWLGLTLGLGAALYAGLLQAAVLLFADQYLTAPYRAYALAYVSAATAALCWWLWRVARGRTAVADNRLLSWPLLATVAATSVATLAGQQRLPGAFAIAAALAGIAYAEYGPAPKIRLDGRATLVVLLALTFGFRAAFGLQALSRTGPGAAFAAASDDGPSYFEHATALWTDPSAATSVLAANDGFPPAYSYFLAAIFSLTRGSLGAVVLAQAVVAVLSALLLYAIARRATGTAAALVAVGLFATEQNMIQVSSTLAPESILVPTVLFGAWVLARYRDSGRFVWLVAGAAAVGLAFITRNNVGGVLLAATTVWLVISGRQRPARVAAEVATLALALLVFTLPVALSTAQLEGKPRITNQLAADNFDLLADDGITIDNGFLVRRGINPIRDPLGSLRAAAADPLAVAGFFAVAVPQRAMTLLFFAPSGAADPLNLVSTTNFPNMYGHLIELVLVLGLIVAMVELVRRRAWVGRPIIGLLFAYISLYLALFTLVFMPRHAFRYRIPIEPVIFIVEAAGVVLIAGLVWRLWSRAETGPAAQR